jgi:hypothetical protein
MDLYEPAPAQAGVGAYPVYPPTPPPPPTYGGGGYINPYAFGGGSSFSGGGDVVIVEGTLGPLGTVRTQHFNTLGHSIIDPPPGLSRTGFTTYGAMRPPNGGATAIPAFNAPISKYVNPYAKFAAPVGLPQRAAPPNFRPGANGTSAVSGGSTVLRSAAK